MYSLLKKVQKPKILFILEFLSARDRLILKLVVVCQILLSILDLVGVALIGLIATLSVYGIQSKDAGNFGLFFMRILGVDDSTFQQQILILSLLTIVILLSKTIASLWITKRSLNFISRRGAILSGTLLRRILNKPSTEINSYSQQELIYASTNGVQNLMTGIVGISMSAIADTFLLILLTIGLFVFNPVLALTTFTLFSLIGTFLSTYLKNKAFKIGSAETLAHVLSNDKMSEVLSTYRESVVRDTREAYVQDFEGLRRKVSNAVAKRTFMPFVSKYVMEVSITCGAFVMAGIQFALYDSKTAIAGLAIFFGASSRIAPAVLRIQQGATQVKSYLGQSQRTLTLLADQTELNAEVEHPRVPTPDFEAIGFLPEVIVSDLIYRYSPQSQFELRVSGLAIGPNKHVAIVGASGSGKTTLVDLILGILRPISGTIEISGLKPLETFKKWPGAVGYVPQETVIIAGTILDNVVLGYDLVTADVEQVKKSLSLAGLSEFLNEDTSGIYLEVGGRGHKLSGGQRQRIGIARALYTNPKLLVLDEATSSLDSATEFDITESLNVLKQNLSLITIAHRLSTVQAADLVIYIEDGEILARGTFEEVRKSVKTFDFQANLLGL
jgi:ATP-binding cassette subfamily C protein